VTERLRGAGWRLAAVGLVAFHLVLLWRRLTDSTLFHPSVAARWALAALLLLAARRLRLLAEPDWSNRRVLALGMAVLMLHLPLVGPSPESIGATQDGVPRAAALLLLPAILVLAIDVGQTLAASAAGRLLRAVDGQERPLGGVKSIHWRPGGFEVGFWLPVRPPPF
jgi:hypothetical protein